MSTVREAALEALAAVLVPLGGRVVRNLLEIAEVEDGLVAIGDGDPGEPEVVLSPLTHSYSHRVPVDVYVEGGDAKEANLDSRVAAVAAALRADRTLGGAVDYLSIAAPDTAFDRVPGSEDLAAARLLVTLDYDTPG